MNPYPASQGLPATGGAPSRLPKKEHLDYIKVLVEVLFLLLAVPWVLRELFRSPGSTTRRVANKHMGGS